MRGAVFVDTSVWVEVFRGRQQKLVESLHLLLDEDLVALAAPVRLEILSGASREVLPRLKRSLSSLPVFFPTEETWSDMEAWIGRAVEAGERFGIGDLLIAAIAAGQGGKVWSLDRDFSRLARLGLIELFDPPSRPGRG